VSNALNAAFNMTKAENIDRFMKMAKFTASHSVTSWFTACMKDLKKAYKPVDRSLYMGYMFGSEDRTIKTIHGIKFLNLNNLSAAYAKTNHRVIIIDMDGTLPVERSTDKVKEEILLKINSLTRDERNRILIISPESKEEVIENFGPQN
jgi:trehalose 6-phosphate synthase/phosphatase